MIVLYRSLDVLTAVTSNYATTDTVQFCTAGRQVSIYISGNRASLGQELTVHWANRAASGGDMCSTGLHSSVKGTVGFFDKKRMMTEEKETPE
jgi:hypothetical protein